MINFLTLGFSLGFLDPLWIPPSWPLHTLSPLPEILFSLLCFGGWIFGQVHLNCHHLLRDLSNSFLLFISFLSSPDLREKHSSTASRLRPGWGLNLQPGSVPCPVIKLVNVRCTGRRSNQPSHTGRGSSYFILKLPFTALTKTHNYFISYLYNCLAIFPTKWQALDCLVYCSVFKAPATQ